jgi:PAS domain S-box-containing protein
MPTREPTGDDGSDRPLPSHELAQRSDTSHAGVPVNDPIQGTSAGVNFQDLYEAAPCGYVVLDMDGKITLANQTFLSMTGLPQERLPGINFRELLTRAGSLFYDSQIIPSLLLNGFRREIALDLVRSDGQRTPVLVNLSLRHEADGVPSEIRMILFEASERRLYERGLLRSRQEAEQRAEVVIHSFDAIVSMKPDGSITSWNKGAEVMFGYSGPEVLGRMLFDLIFPGEGRDALGTARETLARGQFFAAQTVGCHKDGRRIDLSVILTPHVEAPGTLVAFSAIMRDISMQKIAERALLQTEKLASVGRLASSIAHEINNPLESVTNLLYILDTQVEEPRLKSLVQRAQEELARVSQIATHTLRFHRQSGSPTEVDLSQLLGSVLVLYRGRLQNAQISTKIRRCDAQPLQCHEGELRQILLNIVGNAVDAMKKGGRLILDCHEATEWRSGRQGVRITVADTGKGMEPATLARIFEPFFTTKGISGTGLGLWVTQDLISKNFGSIRVRSSVAEDIHGSVFVLFFPH